jgi:hypothetical protein
MKYDRVAQIRIDGPLISAFELCAISKKQEADSILRGHESI